MSERAAWFERKPRSNEEVEPKGTRELLPVKAGPNDRWKRQHVKVKGKRKRDAAKVEAAPALKRAPVPATSADEEVLDTAGKKQRIAKMATQLLQSPHKSIGLLEKLHEYATRDGSAVVRKMALLSEVAALRDLIPAYRIRPPTDKELAMKVSAEVEALRQYEKSLLKSYETVISLLKRWLSHQTEDERLVGVRGLGALLEKGRDFNSVDKIIGALVPVTNWQDEAARGAACAALSELFGNDTNGEATLVAVRQMATLLKNSSFNVHSEMLGCWLSLKLDSATSANTHRAQVAAGRAKKKRRELDPVAKELAHASGDRGDLGLKQAAVLDQIFVSYARVIKKAPRSPLLPQVLRGVAQFAHQVNLELLLDLVSNLRQMLAAEQGLPPPSQLHCVHAMLRLLSGHGSALSVDTKEVQHRLYSLLAEPAVVDDSALLAIALDCLEHLCAQRSNLVAPRVASFVSRLLYMALSLPHGHAVAVLCAASRLLAACPRVGAMLHGGARAATLSNALPLYEDPDAPAALQSTAWQLAPLVRHYHPTVAQLSRKLAHEECLEPRFLKATPLRIMGAYRSESGDFNPAPKPPAARQHAAGGGKPPTKQSNKTPFVPPCSIPEVREAEAAAAAAASIGNAPLSLCWAAAAAPGAQFGDGGSAGGDGGGAANASMEGGAKTAIRRRAPKKLKR